MQGRISSALNDSGNRWCKRESAECNALKEWKLSIINIVDKNINNNKKFRSFKSKENIHKKEVGPYCSFSYSSLISDPLNLAKGAKGKNC